MTMFVRRKATSPFELFQMCSASNEDQMPIWVSIPDQERKDWNGAWLQNPFATVSIQKHELGYYPIKDDDNIVGTSDDKPAVYKKVVDEGYLMYIPPVVAGGNYPNPWGGKPAVKVKDPIDHSKYKVINRV